MSYGRPGRYQRIVADLIMDGPKPFILNRQCVVPTGGRPNDCGLFPGTAMVLGSDRPAINEGRIHGGPTPTFAVAGVNPTGPIYIADYDSLAGRDVWHPWNFNSVAGILVDGRFALNVQVPWGTSVTKGDGLTTNALGWFVPATGGQRVILTAAETFNNNTGIHQLVRCLPVIGA